MSEKKKSLTQPPCGMYISSEAGQQILRYSKGIKVAADGLMRALERAFGQDNKRASGT